MFGAEHDPSTSPSLKMSTLLPTPTLFDYLYAVDCGQAGLTVTQTQIFLVHFKIFPFEDLTVSAWAVIYENKSRPVFGVSYVLV
jgi:hypothetical protein